MKRWLVCATLTVLSAVTLGGCLDTLAERPVSLASSPTVPVARRIVGVYEPYDPGSYWQVSDFAQDIGAQPRLVVYYSKWGQAFQRGFARQVHLHGGKPLVQMDPRQVSISGIAAGQQNAYLNTFAAQVREYKYPVVISFGQEMNGSWYPWGAGHVRPTVFVAAWKHIVNLFEADKVRNVTWLWDVNCRVAGTFPIQAWWPGKRYVTWVGIDGYYAYKSDTFYKLFHSTISEARKLTDRPILIGETAAGPIADKMTKIPDLFRGIRHFKLLGFVWFDQAQKGQPYAQDWRLEGNLPALRLFGRETRAFLDGRDYCPTCDSRS